MQNLSIYDISARVTTGILVIVLIAAFWGLLDSIAKVATGWIYVFGWAATAALPFAIRLISMTFEPDRWVQTQGQVTEE